MLGHMLKRERIAEAWENASLRRRSGSRCVALAGWRVRIRVHLQSHPWYEADLFRFCYSVWNRRA